jgi:hypothetical protein
MRWVADEAAHLVGQDLMTHRLSFTIGW